MSQRGALIEAEEFVRDRMERFGANFNVVDAIAVVMTIERVNSLKAAESAYSKGFEDGRNAEHDAQRS